LTHPLMIWSFWNKMTSKIMCLWNIAPLASQQEVPSVRGAEAPPLAKELSSPSAVIFSPIHWSAAVDLCHPRRAEAIIDRSSSSAIEQHQGRARPAAMERRHHPLAAALEGRPHTRAAPWEVRHHLPRVAATERHPRPWVAATRCRVHHRQRSSALISELVVTATSRCRSRRSRMKILLLFIWSDWILLLLLLFLPCKMLVFSLRSSDSLIRSDWKLQTGLSSVFIWYLYRGSTHTLSFLLETTQSKYKWHKCIHTHWLHMRMDRSTIVRTTVTYSERHTTSIYHHHILLASTIRAHTTTITGSWKSSRCTECSKMWLLDQILLQRAMPRPCILLTVNFRQPRVLVIHWFRLWFATNPPLGILMI
jgi:hypothetical protein